VTLSKKLQNWIICGWKTPFLQEQYSTFTVLFLATDKLYFSTRLHFV